MWLIAVTTALLGVQTPAEIKQCLVPQDIDLGLEAERRREIGRTRAGLIVAFPPTKFMPDDSAARLAGGRTEIEYTLFTNGRAGSCHVTKSSGFKSLDLRSCQLLLRHLVLGPKRKDGMAVTSRQEIAFAWRPAEPDPHSELCTDYGGAIPVSPRSWFPLEGQDDLFEFPAARGIAYLKLGVSATGAPQRCDFLGGVGLAMRARARLCDDAMKHAWLLPAVDANGIAIPTEVRVAIQIDSSSKAKPSPQGLKE